MEWIRCRRASVEAELTQARLLSRSEAAELLNASTSQIDHWTRAGTLLCVDLDRRPRYRLEDLRAFADSRLRHGTSLSRQNMKIERFS